MSLAQTAKDKASKAYLGKLERELGKRHYIAEHLEKAILEAFKRNPIPRGNKKFRTRHVAGERLITVMISDAHFGVEVNKREVPNGGYNWKIAARRMARLATEIAAWKTQHRNKTDLRVILNGDILQGLIHLDDHGLKLITEQIHGATWILVMFLEYLLGHFSRVGVTCLPGNHDRIKRERQTAQRWDSHAHACYLAIAKAFRHEKRISFDVPLTGEGIIEFPGGKSLGLIAHGDVAPTIANVGKALDIKPILAFLNRVNASGEYKKPIRVIGYGHWHTGFTMPTGLGTVFVNGCVIGADSYARNGVGVRGDESSPMQIMFESVPGYEFGDCRFVHLREADKDREYDKIISTPSLEVW